ncbi:MAG: hypothetical protein IRZ32_01580 [Solirubrobacteraceae bacterium]|nr:hypothetical protein [Solirubrobacteraceae bacterium]
MLDIDLLPPARDRPAARPVPVRAPAAIGPRIAPWPAARAADQLVARRSRRRPRARRSNAEIVTRAWRRPWA